MSEATNTPGPTPGKKSLSDWLNDEKVRAVLYQVLAILAVVGVFAYLIGNVMDNLERQNIKTGYDFLGLEAAFEISETPVEYSASDTYGDALFVGFLNTFKVSIIGIVLATVIGTLIGIARLSHNFIINKVATVYVEVWRNIPVLLQLMFWYAFLNGTMPSVRNALEPLPNVFLSNRGMYAPAPVWDDAHMFMIIAAILAIPVIWFVNRWAKQRQDETGEALPMMWIGTGVLLGMVGLAYLIGGAPTAMDIPEAGRFNIKGGARITPEFLAVLIGLTVYTSAFIAEAVRAGIRAVPKGQWEAADSVALKRGVSMRKVILPQAMRVAVPPITNQYLNLTKNSSLAVAVGYPDLVSIGNTTMNQTGQAIEAISIFMTVYLSLSLLTSLFMNWFNDKMKLVER